MGCYLDEGFRCELPANLMGILSRKDGIALSKDQTRAQVGKYRLARGKGIFVLTDWLNFPRSVRNGGSMKITLILVLCLGLSRVVLAEDSAQKVPVKEGYGTLDMKQMGPPGDLPQAKKSNVITKVGCIDVTGKTLSQGDPGFETCVMNRTPKNPGDQPTNLNIQFGQ
jgi:hypothetical protein